MSSICAIWKRHGATDSTPLLQTMLAAQQSYGSDKSFSWGDGRVALGGNLLTLLPEDQFDQQPIWSKDHTACLVADVRLDNRSDLIRDLGLVHGEELADSSVLMEAWLRWEESCLDRILGGFAFAVWNPTRQELFAARDHSGERPLFFHQSPELFALASMPKGLLVLPRAFSGFEEQRLVSGLILARPDWARSFFNNIERVPPGHLLRVTPTEHQCTPYWHPSKARETRFAKDDDYVQAFLEVFDKATHARLRSTKPIGSELSSGLDSSSVTASAARLLQLQGKDLTAFTSVPRKGLSGPTLPGRLVDEGPGAAEVAHLYPNIHHLRLDSEGQNLFTTLTEVTAALDEPVQNGVNQLWISTILQRARQLGIGVMLQGALGNATISFDGKAALATMLREGRWTQLARTAHTLRRNGHISARAAASMATNGLLPDVLQRLLKPDMAGFSLDYSPIHPDYARRHHLLEKMSLDFFGDRPDPSTDRAHFFERFDFGPSNAATRALYGIDPRDPCGDRRVFDFCYSIPMEQYLVGGFTRSLIRRAMKGRLPASTLTRTVRGLQAADWYRTIADALPSFRDELIQIKRSPTAHRLLDLDRLTQLSQRLPQTGFGDFAVANAWNHALCRGVTYGHFLRRHEPVA